MKKVLNFAAIALLVLFFGMIAWISIGEYYHENKQREIIRELRSEIERQPNPDNNWIAPIQGRVLVWDLLDDKPIVGVMNKLPLHMNARHHSDGPLTIYMVRKKIQEVGEYSVSHQPAYRQRMQIYIAYWPEKRLIGAATIASREPPKQRKAESKPEFGDPIEPIVHLILNMDRKTRSEIMD